MSANILVRGPKDIKRGNRIVVNAGHVVVITQDGVYKETLSPGGPLPGGHWKLLHMPYSKLQAYWVDTRERTLEVKGEFVLQYPSDIPVQMSVTVFYKVVRPEVVALEVADPLSHLEQWTIDAVRNTLNQLSVEEFLRGQHAAPDIHAYLTGQGVESHLGLKVYDVQIADLDAKAEMDLRTSLRALQAVTAAEGQVADIVSQNPSHLAIKYPELYMNLLEVMKSLAISNFDPQALSNPEQAEQLMSLLSAFMPGQSPVGPGAVGSRHRVQADCAALRGLGFDVTLKENGRGEYYSRVCRQDGHRPPLQIYLVCDSAYPQTAPQACVEVAGEQRDFTSSVIEGWTPQDTLEEVVAEAVNFFGFLLEGGETG